MRKLMFLGGLVIIALAFFYFMVREKNTNYDQQGRPLAMTPVPLELNFAKSWWFPRHQEKLNELELHRDDISIVFIGDSIIQAWEDRGESAWEVYFQPHGAINLGFGGDRTENVLWRVANGQVKGLQPELIVLLVGTNNTGHRSDPAEYTAQAIEQLVTDLHQRMPSAQILLHAIFPRGKTHLDKHRKRNEDINQLIEPLGDRDYVTWVNLNHLFLDADGRLHEDIMSDYLHPNANQYPRWAEALLPYVEQYLKK